MKHVNTADRPSAVSRTTLHPGEAPVPVAGPVRVVIVAAERLFGEALGVFLSSQHGIEIVGEAAERTQALEIIQDAKPDVVLFDPSLPEMDCTQIIGLITQHSPGSRILLLIAARDTADIYGALRAGARGYISKNAHLADVTKAIHGVHHGDMWVERKLFADVLWRDAQSAPAPERTAERASGELTAREREILSVLSSGGTNRHIATTLSISEKTVKTHLNNIFRKLNVTRRLQAVLYAIRLGLRAPD